MLFQCWASVEDGGPTLKQHRVNDPCLLGTRCQGGPSCHIAHFLRIYRLILRI